MSRPDALPGIDSVLLDLDGTIYYHDEVVDGARQLIHDLDAMGIRYACLSNSPSSPRRLSERLERMGLAIPDDHIYSAGAAVADYVLRSFGAGPWVYNLATEGLAEMLAGHVQWSGVPGDRCDVVIAGDLTNTFAGFDRQRTALGYLRQGAALIGVCADRVYPSPRGIEFGSGAFCAMLSYASGVKPLFLGKPNTEFFRRLVERLNLDPARTLLVGDNLESDIAGAHLAGMRAAAVLTGVATREDIASATGAQAPDAVLEQLGDLPGLLRPSR